ncbi:semaphorin-5A-like [Haliotis rufescens]|uniref:semaphorin-5A-like n=1 Tax=Haliotis rufescens TaxID=6454 RepID=UPI001EB09C60|nr:semaphorin-5A-like [Haliotis rufescens]XP_046328749.1 semaphorin-5A-like [Haliotis rufescens]XP_046328750.1 semaphorin-5A-like [Haliotis rufescens]
MDLKCVPVLSVVVLMLLDIVAGQNADVGAWTKWSQWSACSESCGSGITSRTRHWEQPKGETPFDKPFTMSENSGCNNGQCPVDGSWRPWGIWSPCSEACGGGIRQRDRTCNPPINDGMECDGEAFEDDECNTVPCPPLPVRFNTSMCATSKYFTCKSGKMCIPMSELCDDTVQCHDGSDEKSDPCFKDNRVGSVHYQFVKDTGASHSGSLSVIVGLVVMVIMMHVIGHC